MARQTTIQLTDDIDGSEAVEALTFAVRGVEYEIDLSAKNVVALEKALAKFIAAGRRVGAGATERASHTNGVKGDLGDLRQWARANGYAISNRGRISAEVREAYDARDS